MGAQALAKPALVKCSLILHIMGCKGSKTAKAAKAEEQQAATLLQETAAECKTAEVEASALEAPTVQVSSTKTPGDETAAAQEGIQQAQAEVAPAPEDSAP